MVNTAVVYGGLSGRNTRNSEQIEGLVKASETPSIKGEVMF